jgi:hypothetical protein
MNRRAFSACLAVTGLGLPCLLGRLGHAMTVHKPVAGKNPEPTAEPGVEASIEKDVLRIEYRLPPSAKAQLRVPPPQATFVTAVLLSSQRPRLCRCLAEIPGVTTAGPTYDGRASYRAAVRLSSLLPPSADDILIHVSFWQYQSGVLQVRLVPQK